VDKYLTYINYGILILVIALVIWMIEDSLRRMGNKWVFPIVALVFTFLPFLIGVILANQFKYYFLGSGILFWLFYLLLRPEYTKEEIKMIQMEQKTRDLKLKYYEYELAKSGKICPVCGLPVENDYMICPNCFKELREKCSNCGKLIDVNWTICPFCRKKVSKGGENEIKNI
jgi:RNA polymerase subunit RPABC4/transcription elongation factor Spt4